ncbi:MAG: rRNA maturation RNase YbeY [Owenweeksia sp.]
MIQFTNLPVELEGRESDLRNWLNILAKNHQSRILKLSYNFVSNEEILSINWQYLKHDYYTDIITFGYVEGEEVEGEIYIGKDQVRTQAEDYQTTFVNELLRIMAHGLLHLIGFNDETREEKIRMKEEEEKSLILHAQISGN